MKIAFLYKFFPSCGGVERVMTILANELVRQGIGVCIYSFRQCIEHPAYPLESSIQIVPLPNSMRIESTVNAAFLVEELRNNAIDILFNHDSTSDSMELCRRVKEKMPIKIVTLHHGQIYLPRTSLKTIAGRYSLMNPRNSLFPCYYLYDRMRRCFHHHRNMRISDVYVLLSEAFRKQLGCSSKLRVMPNPLSFTYFFPMKEYAAHKENLVLMVGRLSEAHKRFSLALQVWEHIEKDTRFNDWNFEIIGDGDDRSFVENLIENRKLKRVRMVGQAQPEAYYRRAKLLIMTSAFEGFPLVLMEAAQNACVPVVMDSFETLHDLIRDGTNGLIVRNNDVDAFVESMQLLMETPQQLEKMAAWGVENSRRYTPSSLVIKWIKLFNDILVK